MAPVKPTPVTVTGVAAVTRPTAGFSAVITGRTGATAVKVSALLVPPAVTILSPAAPAARGLTNTRTVVEVSGV